MSNQIEQYRVSFGAMDLSQKKRFIDSVKQQLETTPNPEWSSFLNECIYQYNAEVRGELPAGRGGYGGYPARGGAHAPHASGQKDFRSFMNFEWMISPAILKIS